MYLIVGANGYLGAYLIQAIREKTGEPITATARTIPTQTGEDSVRWVSCDISDRSSVDRLADQLKADGGRLRVIVCAAFHHPDEVEREPRRAWDVNITSLSYLLNRLENVDDLYYPSTDSVYGDSIDGYRFREEDMLSPVNTYGRQKALAEQLVVGYGYHVVRFPFLIGPSLVSHKVHFYDRIVTCLKSGQPVDMFSDSYRSSLDFASAAGYLTDLIECGKSIPGIVNLCGDDALSKYEIGVMIAEKLGVSPDLIHPISVQASEGIFTAKRARSTLMNNTKMKELLGIRQAKIFI